MGYVRGDSKIAKNSRLRLSQKFLSDLEEHYNKIGHRAIESLLPTCCPKRLSLQSTIN